MTNFEALQEPRYVFCDRGHKRNEVIAESCPACEFGKPRKIKLHAQKTLDKIND